MEIKSKYPQKLIDKAHDLAFRGELSNKAIAAKLGLDPNQLHYIIYKLEDSGAWVKNMKKVMKKASKPVEPKKITITESFLNFFTSESFK
jgi:transcription initiation factor IIE alpha subunit